MSGVWSTFKKPDKRHYLLAVFTAAAVFMLAKSGFFTTIDNKLKIVISGQKGRIRKLNAKKNISEKKTILVDILNFKKGNSLIHAHYGQLDYKNNFFMDIRGSFRVSQPAYYTFHIGSDDGFRLRIDNKTICRHPGTRPFAWNKGRVYLEKGLHRLKISYFQGCCLLGLKGKYQKQGENKQYFIGQDSKYINFRTY
ncbi:MAG TPA: PA14 domain-containing protein [Spirochaetota bacterium]|nr:PA14 domain-containing protein [Spirochaetota bacterium]